VALAIGLALGLAAFAFLLILVLGLVRHLKVLTASLRRFQDEVQPVLKEIQRQSVTAQERMQELNEGPGGRLRR
jgi:hypothetical protein